MHRVIQCLSKIDYTSIEKKEKFAQLTVTFADSLHPRAHGASAGLAVVPPHEQTGQTVWAVDCAFLQWFLTRLRPLARESLAKVDVLVNSHQN